MMLAGPFSEGRADCNAGTTRMQSDKSLYEMLKADITAFVFKPGERLVENELSRRYGVSRTPIREALRRLEHEGLIIANSKTGRFVPHFNVGEYEDVYAVRIALEKLAVAEACKHASIQEIESLRQTWEGPFSDAPVVPDGRYIEANERFHAGLADLSKNAFLAGQLRQIRDRIRIIILVDFTVPERIEATRREHNQILDAIAERDSEKARHLIANHIEVSKQQIRQLVSKVLAKIYLPESETVLSP